MNFNELNQLLSEAGSGTRAAECHGFLCGYFCSNGDPEEEVVRNCLLADIEGDLLLVCLERIRTLAADVHDQITSPDFALKLLLPDDTRPLSERGASFIQWCEGFLSGLGAAGALKFFSLSSEGQELLDDLYKICRLDPQGMHDSAPDEEYSLMELIEYVRMGAILIYEEFHRSEDLTISQPVFH